MTVLELRFPVGRFHATSWGHHVNEGAIEWPPSPWRIIRALIATWYLKARDIPETTVRSLVGALSQPPSFCLPQVATAHTRHYMPYNEGKNEKTTKVFDTFIQLPEGGAVFVVWNATLSPEELQTLSVLASRLGYLGRAESLVEARVLEGITGIKANATPLIDGTATPEQHELVRVLSPMTPNEYEAWRTDFLVENESPAATKKKSGKKAKGAALDVPPDLFAALHADTRNLQAAGWNLPPGARFVDYIRPENAFALAPRPRPQRKGTLPTVARYAVVSTVAPRITQAISVGDRVHDALCKWSDQGKGSAIVFTGLDAGGKTLGGHQHAHVFCEANGPRDAITHITVWAGMGFDENACLALRRLNKVWGHGGHDIRLILHGIGQPGDFAECKLFGPAMAWRSLTPFVATRHAKTFRDGRPKIDPSNGWQIGSPGHDLLRLLAEHSNGHSAHIKQSDERQSPYRFGERHLRSLQFQTVRYGGNGSRGQQNGAFFTIVFPKPRQGPFALGYGAHFGLGLFVPVADVAHDR